MITRKPIVIGTSKIEGLIHTAAKTKENKKITDLNAAALFSMETFTQVRKTCTAFRSITQNQKVCI